MTYRRISLFISQFILFITLKIRDRACLIIEKSWFLLAHRLAKNTKGNYFKRKQPFLKNAVSMLKLLFFYPSGNEIFICHAIIIFFSSLNIMNYSKCVQIRSFFWSVFSRIQTGLNYSKHCNQY